jgi:hypothetical protein
VKNFSQIKIAAASGVASLNNGKYSDAGEKVAEIYKLFIFK